MKKLKAILLLAVISASAAMADGVLVVPATQAEVNVGTNKIKYVSPATLAGAGVIGTNGVNGLNGYGTIVITNSLVGSIGSSVTVTNLGDDNTNAVLQFTFPPPAINGTNGDNGANASIAITNTVTGAVGSSPTVTNVGTSLDAILQFHLPAVTNGTNGAPGVNGTNGSTGPTGATGPAGPSGTNGAPGRDGTNAFFSSSFTYSTNLTIPVIATNWTIVIPAVATNYVVCYELYLQAKVDNPSGIAMPLSSIKKVSEISGYTQPLKPYNIFSHIDGKTFVISTDGDYASFVDEASQPVLLNPPAVAAGFSIRAVFTWTILK